MNAGKLRYVSGQIQKVSHGDGDVQRSQYGTPRASVYVPSHLRPHPGNST